MQLEIEEKPELEESLIVFKGDLHEHVVFPRSKIRLLHKLVFDCDKLTAINSMGLQKWSEFLRDLNPKQQIVLRRCRSTLIRTMAVVPDVLPQNCTVESFYTPYECENCGYEEEVMMLRGKDYVEKINDFPSRRHFPERLNCPKCKSDMKISVMDPRFFNFLESKKNYV